MAAVVRVKRRISEDPAEALIVSCKRQRQDGDTEAAGINLDERIRFSYAGTLNSKDVTVPRQIRDAISKQNLQAQYKQHAIDISETCRSNRRAAAKASRYKVVCKRRAGPGELEASESDTAVAENTCEDGDGHQTQSNGVQETEHSEQSKSAAVHSDHTAVGRLSVSETTEDSAPTGQPDRDIETNNTDTSDSTGEEILHVYDVEQDEESSSGDADRTNQQAPSSGITCNGVELVSERVPPPVSRLSEAYVYDLYYTNSTLYDFRALENILSIQALHDELVLQGDRDEDCDDVYEDEDDSNDEDNWRNDYPDEDPHFFENEAGEFHYNEDILAHEPESFYYGEDDDLADWMSARCNVEDEENLPSGSEDDTDLRD
ncbi:hypothetical protein BaRGS_00027047 [Batillaria attramentaria]|uniref:Probable RNA polymerase II nuclear localization protein SLC7A6OS n=1 Tax=Batillaria attramentaria TaxID=370345 RepID=A0ABD0K357_9CAEN